MTRRTTRARGKQPATSRIDDILRDSVQRGARRSALALLADVRAARDRLDDLGDKEALHDFRVALRRLRSWLRAFRPALADTMSSKVEQRLKRIAAATGSSRDLEVHVEWVKSARRSLSDSARGGATWLLQRLRRDQREADADFRSVIYRKFDRAAGDAEAALSRYQASVDGDDDRFATVAAETIELQMVALSNAVARVTGQGDRAEAHATRIAAKRLRYLLEGVEAASPSAGALIEELKTLQDTLGELHDAQLFAGELATMISELLAGDGPPAARRTSRPEQARTSSKRPNLAAGLRVLSRRMRRAEEKAFHSYAASWSAEATEAFGSRVAAVAAELRAVGASAARSRPRSRRTRVAG
jgi:CHAD domain-containing protein